MFLNPQVVTDDGASVQLSKSEELPFPRLPALLYPKCAHMNFTQRGTAPTAVGSVFERRREQRQQ